MTEAEPNLRLRQMGRSAAARILRAVRDPERAAAGMRAWANLSLKRRPSSHPFISGDTFREISNHVWEGNNPLILPGSIRRGDVIFCESDRVDSFASEVLSRSRVPIVLLLSNSDTNHASEIARLFQRGNVHRIFAQNLIEPTDRVSVLPIGLENAWWSRNGRTRHFTPDSGSHATRIFRVMWTFSIGTNPAERSRAAAALSGWRLADSLGGLKPAQHRQALRTFAFVASPPGNGLDTHRTWEAMYLGCVPIVLRSTMTEFYESIGLPVWIVDSFEDLQELCEADLRSKYLELLPRFQSDALWSAFWVDRIQSSSRQCLARSPD